MTQLQLHKTAHVTLTVKGLRSRQNDSQQDSYVTQGGLSAPWYIQRHCFICVRYITSNDVYDYEW